MEKKARHIGMQELWVAIHRREYRAYLPLVAATYAYILLAVPLSLPRLIILVGLGVVYTLVGLFGLEYSRHASSKLVVFAYLAEQITISCVILFFSQGTAFLLFMPVVVSCVVLLPRRGVTAMCGFLLLLLVLIDWSVGQPWRYIMLMIPPMLASSRCKQALFSLNDCGCEPAHLCRRGRSTTVSSWS